MSRYCLDTSAYSEFKRGEPEVAELLESADWVGARRSRSASCGSASLLGGRLERSVAELREFLASPVVHEIVVDREVGRIYGEIVVALRKAGTPVPTNDVWIAAAAAHTGTSVLTYDEHFGAIQRVGSIILTRR